MSEAFLGEVRLFGLNFAPLNWMFCSGQILPIQQNTALFSLLGTTYGGNGTTNFQLPDLRGNVVAGAGSAPGLSSYVPGETGGGPTVTLLTPEMPAHTHTFSVCSLRSSASTAEPSATRGYSKATGCTPYVDAGSPTQANANFTALSPVGASAPHPNVAPFLTVNYCICVNGTFPTRP